MNKKTICALLGAVLCLSGCGTDAGPSSALTGAQSAAEISDSSDAADSTETESQTAASPERLFGGYVTIKSGSLKLRREPNDSSDMLAAIPAGTQLDVFASGVNGWYKVSYDGHTGYVSAKYVREIEDDDTHAQTTVQTDQTAQTDQTTQTGQTLQTTQTGQTVQTTQTSQSAQTVQTEATRPRLLFAGFADGGEAGVDLLAEPKAGAKVIGKIPNGTGAEFCESGKDGWYFVHFNGRDGYVQAEYARKSEETKPPVSDAEKKALEPVVGMWFEAGVMFARTLVVSEDGSFQLDYRGGGSMYGTVSAETADGETRYCFYDEEQELLGRYRKTVENGMAELLPDSEDAPAFERSVTDADN